MTKITLTFHHENEFERAVMSASFALRQRARALTRGSAVNTLHNGIWIGPGDITSRIMETANLDQIEFLKGPSALKSGLNAIGGSVNFVSRQPHTGAIKSKLARYVDGHARHPPHAFRLGWQHRCLGARLSLR